MGVQFRVTRSGSPISDSYVDTPGSYFVALMVTLGYDHNVTSGEFNPKMLAAGLRCVIAGNGSAFSRELAVVSKDLLSDPLRLSRGLLDLCGVAQRSDAMVSFG